MPKNIFEDIGEFFADMVDGSIFDLKSANANKETKPNDNGNGNANESEPKLYERIGSTFKPATAEKGKGTAVNSGNGGKTGNDGSGVSDAKGNETGATENKPEPK